MTFEHLFSPVNLGAFELTNRIVLAPMTRNRATPQGVPFPYVADYYTQRASGGIPGIGIGGQPGVVLLFVDGGK